MTNRLIRLQKALRIALEEEHAARQAFERARQRRREVKRELVAEQAALAGYPFGCVAQGSRGQRILVDDAEVTSDGAIVSLTGHAVRRDGTVGRVRRTVWFSDKVRRVGEGEIAD